MWSLTNNETVLKFENMHFGHKALFRLLILIMLGALKP